MSTKDNYHEIQNKQNIQKLRAVLETLPPFCGEYFRGIADTASARTRLAYAYDIRVFFEFLHEKNPYCSKIDIKDFPISVLEQVTRQDIEEYLSYVSFYEKEGREITNTERGKARKLSALRSFYNYYFQNERI